MRVIGRWALRNPTLVDASTKLDLKSTIQDLNQHKLTKLVIKFSCKFLGFQEKLMSNCANELVFTAGLIFLFTILFIYYIILPYLKVETLYSSVGIFLVKPCA